MTTTEKLFPDEILIYMGHASGLPQILREGQNLVGAIKYTRTPIVNAPEVICDKDPQLCWFVRCHLGKKCAGEGRFDAPVGEVKIPESIDEARMMALLSINYLEQHAPEALRTSGHLKDASGLVRSMEAAILYLKSCGAEFFENHDPERQMLEDMELALKKYHGGGE